MNTFIRVGEFRRALVFVWAVLAVMLSLPQAQEGGDYDKWFIEHLFVRAPAQAIVAQHLQSSQDFSPRQKPGSFSADEAMQMLMKRKGDN